MFQMDNFIYQIEERIKKLVSIYANINLHNTHMIAEFLELRNEGQMAFFGVFFIDFQKYFKI